MSNPSKPPGTFGNSAVQTSSQPAATNADNVAESVRTAPQPAAPQPSQSAPRPSVQTAPVQMAPVMIHRDSVTIDIYWSTKGSDIVTEQVRDEYGKLVSVKVEKPWRETYTAKEEAYINDDGTATLVDGSISDLPYGPGKPGCYGRPGVTSRAELIAAHS